MATLERIAIDYQALVLFYIDHYDNLSNLLEDFRKVKEFIKSVDAQSSTISQ